MQHTKYFALFLCVLMSKGDEKVKGSFQLTEQSSMRFALPGQAVRLDASSSPCQLPKKSFLLEISSVMCKSKERSFYLSFEKEDIRSSFVQSIESLIKHMKGIALFPPIVLKYILV